MEECHKLLTDQVDDVILRYNVSKPLPLGGDPGHVIIQSDFFFNKNLEYLWCGRKMGRPALSISKMKAAYYPDVGLEQMVLDQMWIEEECKYDVATMYDDCPCKADLRDMSSRKGTSKITCILSNFEDMYLLKSLKGQIWGSDDFRVEFNEIHKFSDDTLQQIDEALDYRVNRMNPGLDTRFWTKKDVDRSKEFMFSIQKHLKTRRILQNLESFVGRRIKEGDYRLLKRTK
ncbi:hypothetical protein Tco_1439359 [Tanacetum coccineum]